MSKSTPSLLSSSLCAPRRRAQSLPSGLSGAVSGFDVTKVSNSLGEHSPKTQEIRSDGVSLQKSHLDTQGASLVSMESKVFQIVEYKARKKSIMSRLKNWRHLISFSMRENRQASRVKSVSHTIDAKVSAQVDLSKLLRILIKHPILLQTEGIFRVTGSIRALREAKDDSEVFIDDLVEMSSENNQQDLSSCVHIICGLLKDCFKRSLDDADRAQIAKLLSRKVAGIAEIKLDEYPDSILILLELLVEVVKQCELNKMTANNLALIFSVHFIPEASDQQLLDSRIAENALWFEAVIQLFLSKTDQACGGYLDVDSEPEEENITTLVFRQ